MKKFITLLVLLFLPLNSIKSQYISQGLDYNAFTKVDAPYCYLYRASLGKIATASFSLNYDSNVPSNVRTAVNEAANIWSFLITATIPIRISIKWAALTGGILASTNPHNGFKNNFPNAPMQNVEYPYALADNIAGQDLDSTITDFETTINSGKAWYTGIDGETPANQYDLVTLIMHEIEHGLGMMPSFTTTSNTGSWGNAVSGYPTIYDHFISDGTVKLTNTTVYPNPGSLLYNELVGNSVVFDGNNSIAANGGNKPRIYSPYPWQVGSSISHLDQSTFPFGSPNSLMTSGRAMAEAIHSPGNIGLGILQDLGWTVNRLITVYAPNDKNIWTIGSIQTIKWTSNFPVTSTIGLYQKQQDNSYNFYQNLSNGFNVVVGNNQFSWTIPSGLPIGFYKIKIENSLMNGESCVFQINTANTVPPLTVTPSSGRFVGSVTITITCPDPLATIYWKYAQNAEPSDPTTSDAPMTSPGIGFPYIGNWVFKFKAFRNGYNPSQVFEVSYNIVTGVTLTQVIDGSQTGFGNAHYWDQYSGWINADPNGHYDLPLGDLPVLASQNFAPNTTQKFHFWKDNKSNVTYKNWDTINIGSDITSIVGQFSSTFNATIKNVLEGYPTLNSGHFYLQDPWFVDDNSDSKGIRNRGVNAQWVWIDNSISLATSNSARMGVFLNQNPLFEGGKPIYKLWAGNQDNVSVPNLGLRNLYFQGWSAIGASLSSTTGNETWPVFTSDSAVVQANYKGTQLSNNPNSFANNSQRKFIRTPNGTLHLVYESLGHVWYEKSSDNGTTWYIANNGKPLDQNGGKLPAIDFNYDHDVAIVWEENYYGFPSLNVGVFGGDIMYNWYPKNVFTDINQIYNNANLNPVIAYDAEGRGIIAWEKKSVINNIIYPLGIFCKYGPLGAMAFLGSYTWDGWDTLTIPSNGNNYIYPTISAARNPTDQYNMVYNLAWEYYQSSTNSSIYACQVKVNGSLKLSATSTVVPSSGAGFWQNYNPSIVSMNDNTAKLVWTGYAPWYGNRMVFNYNNTSNIWSSSILNAGSNVLQSHVNNTDDGNFVIGWAQNNLPLTNNMIKGNYLYHIYTLPTTGNNIQMNNASSWGTMYAMAFQNQTVPYSFRLSPNVGGFQKATNLIVNKGRAEVIKYNGTDYCFGAGDVTVDGQNVDFVPLAKIDGPLISDTLNYFLKTNNFKITENSEITFGLFHGMIKLNDTTSLINSLGNDDNVQVKVILVDAQSDLILSEIGNYTVKKGELFQTDITRYNFYTKDLGTRSVRIELKLKDNIQAKYTINDFFGDASSLSLGKSSSKDITYKYEGVPTTYSIYQNYPNPFNPSTTIKYQIPKIGFVTLKIFDILGREVTTLVNENKTEGFYEVNFNASKLASGVYIYQLKANDFIESKKMILAK
jgi:hypothetical protein